MPLRDRTRYQPGWHPVGCVFLTLLVGASAALSNNNFLFLIAALMAGVFIGALVLTLRMLRGVQAERHLPPCGHAGEYWDYQIEVRHPGPGRVRQFIQVQDELDGADAKPASITLPPLQPGHVRRLNRVICPSRRGWVRWKEIKLRCCLPLSLIAVTRSLAGDDRILAFPARRRLSKKFFDSNLAHETGLDSGSAGIENEEFAGVREFRSGDNPRLIHWKTSARLPDQLFLRQFEPQTDQHVTVILDTALPASALPESFAALEHNICFVQSLVESLLGLGKTVTFYSLVPDPVRIELSDRSSPAFMAFKRTLALLEPNPALSTTELLRHARAHPRACCVLVSLSEGKEWQAMPGAKFTVVSPDEVPGLMLAGDAAPDVAIALTQDDDVRH